MISKKKQPNDLSNIYLITLLKALKYDDNIAIPMKMGASLKLYEQWKNRTCVTWDLLVSEATAG